MGKTLEFNNVLEEIPVTIKMKDGEKKFTLREFVGKDRDAWFNFLGQRATIVDGKVAEVKDFSGLQSHLLSLCMHDEKGDKVTEEFIQDNLKATVIEKLFRAAQKLNGLDIGAEEQAKND
jgi:hypothetical protein